uniref:Putative VLF-1 protein n=1 Tax=Chelonus inanitus TaxID=49201 RepID=B9W4A6_9HYME|nr:putative VLF-1 protein [Chelonus inanitus]
MAEQDDFNLPYYDQLAYRPSTIKTHEAHLKKLKQLNIVVSKITNNNVEEVLKYIQKSSPSGKEFSIAYINSIYASIKRENPNVTKHIEYLDRYQSNPLAVNDEKILDGMKNLIIDTVKNVRDFVDGKYTEMESKRLIDTRLAILLTLLTNLRSSELLQLRIKHLHMIDREQTVSIRAKHRIESIKILKMGKLFDLLYPMIIKVVMKRDKLDQHCSLNDLINNTINNSEYNEVLLISSQSDSINKTLRELYANVNQSEPSTALGLKIIRSLNTTLMVQHNELALAQNINRHKDINVTLRHYNLMKFESNIGEAYIGDDEDFFNEI